MTPIASLLRDRRLPPGVLAGKARDYLAARVGARWRLRGVDHVGRRPRTVGRPYIRNAGSMVLGSRVTVRSVVSPVELRTGPGARLALGDGSHVNYGAVLDAERLVSIGRYVDVGPWAVVTDHDGRPGVSPRPVVVEDEVFLGTRCCVLPGVRIGRGSVVGARAVVTHDVPPFTVVAGCPARVMARIEPSRFRSRL
ncbi:MAG TPA: acyltransferase [Jiangellales bacterium]|nr:acyltransferase [Jiangellales bacterium]